MGAFWMVLQMYVGVRFFFFQCPLLRLPFFLRDPPMYTTLLVGVLLLAICRRCRPPFAFVFVVAGVPAFSVLRSSLFFFSLSYLVALGVAPGSSFALLVRFRPVFLSSFVFFPGSLFSGVPFAFPVRSS